MVNNLRNLGGKRDAAARIEERRTRISAELGMDLSALRTDPDRIGNADERNCEQMFGTVPIPVGYAGPLTVTFSSKEKAQVHLPLATTEAALVASVNRGCKALSVAGGVRVTSVYHGISRSIAFKALNPKFQILKNIQITSDQWIKIGEATSAHLKILNFDVVSSGDYLFLTMNADTSEAMGMNMVTIAAQEIGNWIAEHCDCELITIAANVDSDKKPSRRTHDLGRGYEVIAEATMQEDQIRSILKTTPEAMREVAEAKLTHGSKIAGAIGSNLHAANVIAALYLATGQDAAHVVEGSLADTEFLKETSGYRIRVRLPAVLVGVRGGGTGLPAQSQCLQMLLTKGPSSLPKTQSIAEIFGSAVCAGEMSLLAAQSAQHLASAHRKLARSC